MTVKHSSLTGTALHQPFYTGLDSAKPAVPAVGDHYYATDTKKVYQCQVAGAWVQVLPASLAVAGTFVNGDLSTGKLTITHNKALSAPYTLIIEFADNNGKKVVPDIDTAGANAHIYDFTAFSTLSGTWGYRYI